MGLLRKLTRWLRRRDENLKIAFRDLIESSTFMLLGSVVILLTSIVFLCKFSGFKPLQSPGTIFVVTVGFVTILGFYFTWRSIKSSYYISQITAFPDLLRRIEEIVVETIKRKEGAPLKIVCFTPAVGNLSANRDFKKVKTILYELMNEPQKIEIEIICLHDPENSKYEDMVKELRTKLRKKDTKKLLEEILNDSEDKNYGKGSATNSELKKQVGNLVQNLMKESSLFKFYLSYGVIFKEKYGIGGKERPFFEAYLEARELIQDLRKHGAHFYMVREDFLPDFHLLLDSKRVIAYVPLSYYPYFFEQHRWWPKISLNREEIYKLVKNQKTPVEIFGFETTEKNLLIRFEEYFEFCRRFLQ